MVVDSRAARWASTSTSLVEPARDAASDGAVLAARARRLAGAAALQARLAERRGSDARARRRAVAAAGAVAVVASLGCSAVAAVPGFAPDLVAPQICRFAAVAAVLLGIGPAILLVVTAFGRIAVDPSAATVGSAATLMTLGADFARAIGSIEMAAHPEIARSVGALLGVLEREAGATAKSARPQGTDATARRHQRIVPFECRVVVRTADGRNLIGTIADVSLSGVALTACLPRLAVGDAARVGSRPAIVARIWERGIAFQFDQELDSATFDEAIAL